LASLFSSSFFQSRPKLFRALTGPFRVILFSDKELDRQIQVIQDQLDHKQIGQEPPESPALGM
jgi:hypothetical protein